MTKFPPINKANSDGLLALGGDLEVSSLLLAYKSGIFPWPAKDTPILWFAPPRRAILDFKNFKIPKRLIRDLKKTDFTFRVNHDFTSVIQACSRSQNRGKQKGTWITQKMIHAYSELHKAGYAHSFETYDKSGTLVGGLYGVLIGKMFAGESMFYLKTNASKFALIHTVGYLKELGSTWMDIQMITPLLESFGAKEIPRKIFMKRLKMAIHTCSRIEK